MVEGQAIRLIQKLIVDKKETHVFGMLLVMLIAFILIFLFSLLEFVWCAFQHNDVVALEQRRGFANPATRTTKVLLGERMVVVNFILLLIHLVTYFTPMLLGKLSQDTDGVVTAMLVAYGIVLFFGGEMTAKNLGYRWMTPAAVGSALPLQLLLKTFAPITWALRWLSMLTGGHELRLYREEDVIATAQAAREHGALDPREVKLITDAIALGNRRVRDLLIPLGQCLTIAIEPSPTRQELTDAATRHSHVIVRATPGGNIVGLIMRKDVMAFLSRTNLPPNQTVDLMKEKELKPCGMVELPQDWPIAKAYEFLNGDDACEVVDEQGRTVGILRSRRVANALLGIESE